VAGETAFSVLSIVVGRKNQLLHFALVASDLAMVLLLPFQLEATHKKNCWLLSCLQAQTHVSKHFGKKLYWLSNLGFAIQHGL
jgi:hypothetical protein